MKRSHRRASVVPSVAATLTLVAVACTMPHHTVEPEQGDTASVARISIYPDRQFQTIRNFGASDAWSIQFVGRHWPADKRGYIADLLFSLEEREDGSPVGIGLSAWRFNLGAGSARQGDESGIDDRWRRAGSFLRRDGSFDPEGQPGQRAFLREAAQRGVEQFYAFSNSPPVQLTANGKAHSDDGLAGNLRPERYDEFAAYLRDVVVTLRQRDGVEIDYLSPFNEPQWDWTGGQEGSPWRNAEIAAVTRVLSEELTEVGAGTKIEIPETARMNYLYERADKPSRGEQVRAFFSPSSPHHVADLPNVAKSVAAHSYFTTYPADTLRSVRQRVREEILAVDPALELIVSEYCILENNPLIRGGRRDMGMDAALYVAGVIHADLVDAHAAAWQWWLAVSPYDYKDGLVYIDRDTLDGGVYESKLLWTLGHYSRFVRPGMRRIAVETSPDTEVNGTGDELLVSAYQNPATERTVTVLVNRGYTARPVQLEGMGEGEVRLYRTSAEEGDDLRYAGHVQVGRPLELPARSMTTLVIH